MFNSRKFWDAHEAWESIWQRHPEDARFFIQGLIQLAAAYHQLLRQIHRGFLIHMRRARERLLLFPEDFLGIDVGALLTSIGSSLEAVDTDRNVKDVDFSTIEIPQITSPLSQSECDGSAP